MNHPLDPRLAALIDSFPVMAQRRPNQWTWENLEQIYPTLCSSQRCAVNFALNVWNHSTKWEEYGFGAFNLRFAFGVWGPDQREAFLKWVCDPWFL